MNYTSLSKTTLFEDANKPYDTEKWSATKRKKVNLWSLRKNPLENLWAIFWSCNTEMDYKMNREYTEYTCSNCGHYESQTTAVGRYVTINSNMSPTSHERKQHYEALQPARKWVSLKGRGNGSGQIVDNKIW